MKQTGRLIFFSILTILMSSCIIEYQIKISESGISNVQITSHHLNKDEILSYDSTAGPAAELFYTDEPTKNNQPEIITDSIEYRYRKSSVIADFEATSSKKVHYKSSFTVLNLDSLGAYLSPLLEFSDLNHYLNRDSFSIVCPPVQDSLSIMEYGSCMFIEMTYVLPYEILNAYSSSSWIDVRFHKNLYIKTRVDHHNFATENSVVTAKFK